MNKVGLSAGLAGFALVVGASLLACGAAHAEGGEGASPPDACAPKPFRWLEDCSGLAGRELAGLERLRYLPIGHGSAWLTLGAEARARMDLMDDVDFHIAGASGYTEVSHRLLAHADLRTEAGPRLFLQLVVVGEHGRWPGPRGQDASGLDVSQAFVDLPFRTGQAAAVLRLGRQELDLSGNRLVSPRDGSTLRRTYQGVELEVRDAGARVVVLSVHPMDLRDPAFGDRPNRAERFTALSVDLPRDLTGGGALNLFALERDRPDARWLRATGKERRYTLGAHYAGRWDGWRLDAQAGWQFGRAAGLPVRAYGWALTGEHPIGTSRFAAGFDFVAASGDRAATRAIETFDPTYPNNGGLSDAPLFYQTNYVFAGPTLSARWAGAIWSVGSNILMRHSTTDAVYSNGRPIPAPFGTERLTSLLAQGSVRAPIGANGEVYASVVRAAALGGIRGVGGRDAVYSRIQLTARF